MTTPQQLLDSTIRNAVHVEGLKSGEVKQFTAFLQESKREIIKKLSIEDITAFSRTRFEKILSEINVSLKVIFDDYYTDLSGRLLDIAEYEAQFEARSITNAIPTFEAVAPTLERVKNAIYSQPLSVRGPDGGKLLEPFIKDWSSSERKAIVGAIRQGYFEGQTTPEIVRKIRGTRANGFKDGVLNTTKRHAEAIARTSIQHVANTGRAETWKANADIIEGYRIIATLDSRTTPICRTLDNKLFKEGKGPIPPLHINCRSTTVAEIKGEKYKKIREAETRASKDGPVKADQNYYKWLKTQTISFQDDVLGKARGKLFRDGGLSAERFSALQLDRNFKPLTLSEMQKKEPLAFEKAKI